MNKILIIGHSASGHQEVEALLHQCGMQPAQPSRREGLRAQDITATLCKVHGAPPLDEVVSEDELQQVQVGAVWHGMALDLMLGNLDQSLWGWADPHAVFLMDFWEQLDPKLTFVLVYDTPHRVLIEAARRQGDLPTGPALERLLDNWAAYNGALLRFFLRHPGRCLLVHSQQVRRAVDSYLQQLQPLVGGPLLRAPATAALPEAAGAEGGALLPVSPTDASALPVPAAMSGELLQAVQAAGVEARQAATLLAAGAAEHYLVDGILAEHPAALQLYAELESVASLPWGERLRAEGDVQKAWLALVQQRALVAELLLQLHARYRCANGDLEASRETLSRLERQLQETSGEARELSSRLSQAQEELAGALSKAEREAQAAAERVTEVKDLAAENELLLNQLHQVQEALERYYLENQQLKQKLPKPKPPGPVGAADRIKRQLSYRLGAVMIQRSRTFGGWLSMPWALWAETRAFHEERAARAHEKLPPIHTYRDAHEAERVKQHLSYRLGSTMIVCTQSPLGWLKLPFALHREVRDFKLRRQQKQK